MHIIVCLDVASLVHIDDAFKRLAVGDGSDESEYTEHAVLFVSLYCGDLAGLDVLHLHPLKDVVSAYFLHNGIPHKVKLWILERFLLDGLGRTQLVPSVDDGYLSRELGQVHRLFHCGVAAAYHINFKVLKEVGVAGRAVRYSLSKEFRLALAADGSCVSAGGNDHISALVLSLLALQHFYIAIQLYFFDRIGDTLSAKLGSLLGHSRDQGRS